MKRLGGPAFKYLILILAFAGNASANQGHSECTKLLTSFLGANELARLDFSDEDHHSEALSPPSKDFAERQLQIANELERINIDALPREGRPTVQDLRFILQKVVANPVSCLERLGEFDPNGNIGFCPARALTAHIETMLYDVRESFIRKAFVTGDISYAMDRGTATWRYHMATIVLANDDNWYALDPLLPQLTALPAWIKHFSQHAKAGVALYITHARRVSPEAKSYYHEKFLRVRSSRFQNDQARIAKLLRELIQSFGLELPNSRP